MKETEDGVCVGGERQGAKERKEAVAFPAATGERHVSFSCSLRGRLRTAGTFQSFPCMRETLHLGSRKVKFCFFSMRYICCSIKESSDILPTKGPFTERLFYKAGPTSRISQDQGHRANSGSCSLKFLRELILLKAKASLALFFIILMCASEF